jgi:hypothetical protein
MLAGRLRPQAYADTGSHHRRGPRPDRCQPPSTPYDDNPTWHEVNRQLNANVQFSTVRSADYPVKIGTIMAGNDLPDIIHIYNGISAAPNLPDFFKARCAASFRQT